MAHSAIRWARLGVTAVTLAFVAGLILLDGAALEAFVDIATDAVALGAGGVCFVVARQHRGRAARAWRLLALSCVSWGVGNTIWTWLELVRGVFPFPSAADIGYLLAVPLAAVAMLAFPAAPAQAVGRVRMLLDGTIVTASLVFCSWALVIGPVFDASAGSQLERAITLAYPVGDLLIAVIVVLVLTRAAPSQRRPLAVIGFGLLATATADSGFAVQVAAGTYRTGSPVDVGWVVGYALIALAALESTATTDADPVRGEADEPLWHTVLPYVPMAGVVIVAISRRLSEQQLDLGLFFIAMLLLVALGARQVLTLHANRRLVAQLREREADLAHLALHDPLTRLANRALFDDRLAHALSQRVDSPVAVLFYDLDDFKLVNDSYGHPVGDALLCAVADRLRHTARAGDTVARLGGDEFALVLEGPGDAVDAVARRVLAMADAPYLLDGVSVAVTGSVGVASTATGATREDLLHGADAAMYVAKGRGKGRCAVFEPGMLPGAIGPAPVVRTNASSAGAQPNATA